MYLLTFLGFITVFLSTLLYLPPFSWLQIPLALIGIVFAHLVFAGMIFGDKSKLKYFLMFVLSLTLFNFYLSNWASAPKNTENAGAIQVSLGANSADINISKNVENVSIKSTLFNLVEEPVVNLGQALGKVALSRYRRADGTSFAIVYIESEKLISAQGWAKNKILMRRLGSKLRQLKEPILVVLNCPLSAGSSLLQQFMFQARLEVKASLNPWKSLIGMKAPMLLGREVNFSDEDSEKALRFIVKN